MTSLKEAAIKFKTEKKDLTSLEFIPVDVEVKQATFEKNGQKMPYNYFELNGWKYTIKAEVMEKIQQILAARPTTTKIKVSKSENGSFFVIPID